MRSFARRAVAGLVALVAVAGCGSAASRRNATRATGVADYAQVAEASCASSGSGGRPPRTSCVFVVADGRRFTCPARLAQAAQTAGSLERSAACRALAPLHLSAAVRRVTATIESAQACLVSHRVRAIGGAVLPALAGARSPDGELIAGHLPGGALIAFYRDVAKAKRLEPAVLRNARHLGAQVQRRGTVTTFWVRPPSAALRRVVQACLPRG